MQPSSPPGAPAIWPVIPALRWSGEAGFGVERPQVLAAVDRGAPGFILFGGSARAAREAAEALEARAGRTLLLGADLERGAGQQFAGATPLPPAAALASLGDPEVLRAAGELTAREASALGVPWVFAPVADMAVDPENPIVGTRAFGADPAGVSRDVAAWVQGCLAGGAIPCLKHFPGHGRTRTDSHRELPVVEASRETLLAEDLAPFRAGILAGAPAVMTAHVAFPDLDDTGRPATRSRPILSGLLRDELAFSGVLVSDALIMEGAGKGAAAAAESLAAGVELLLYPGPGVDPPVLAGDAARRVRALLARVRPLAQVPPEWGRRADGARAWSWAVRALVPPGGEGSGRGLGEAGGPGRSGAGGPGHGEAGGRPGSGGPSPTGGATVALQVVDDDLGGLYPPPSREPFVAELVRRGVSVVGAPGEAAGEPTLEVLAVFADPRAWKGRAGLSTESRAAAERWRDGVQASGRAALVVVCGGPRIAADLPSRVPHLLAWGGEPLMQRAAAAWLAERLGGPPAREGNALDGVAGS